MRFGLILAISFGAVLALFSLADFGNPQNASVPPDLTGRSCQVEYVVVLDRTTVLSSGVELLKRGATALTENEVYGNLSVLEIRDNSTGYAVLQEFRFGDQPISPAAPIIRSCPSVSGTYPDPSLLRERNACLEENALNREAHKEERERYSEMRSNVLAQREELRNYITDFSEVDSPTTSRTALKDALREILRARCSGGACILYLFSDMLDTEVKNRVIRQGISAGTTAEFGSDQEEEEFGGNGALFDLAIIGWGIGRSDIDDTQSLSVEQTAALRGYWRSLFESWGASEVYLGLEFPNDFQVDSALGSVCPHD